MSSRPQRRLKKLLPLPDRTTTTQRPIVSAGNEPKAGEKLWVRFNLAEWLEGVEGDDTADLDR